MSHEAPRGSSSSASAAHAGSSSLLPTHMYSTGPRSPLSNEYVRAGSTGGQAPAVQMHSPRNSSHRLSGSGSPYAPSQNSPLAASSSAAGNAGHTGQASTGSLELGGGGMSSRRELSVEMGAIDMRQSSRSTEASPSRLGRQQQPVQRFAQGSSSRLEGDQLPQPYSHVPQYASPTQKMAANPAYNPVTGGLVLQQHQRWEPSPEFGSLSRSGSTRRREGSRSHALELSPVPMAKEMGFRRIRDLGDLRPKIDMSAMSMSRRADPGGGFVSPLKALTSYLHHTYHLVNPTFIYELSFNPRRVLTKPSKPMYNNGHDNEDSDFILYVNDWLGHEEGNRYLILDILGQGTFGQVVKCQNMRTHEIVAVKVIKNKPAYYKQSIMEVTILENLNANWDPEDKHHILRLRDTFIHAEHLCLVFELLSSNLYELIKQNSFKGLSTSLVRVFTTQLLDALTVLNEARLIHCDLKPENILLRTLQAPSIKLVDFGSACHEKQTVYTYIQSRFYRSPEVLLGLPYNSSIDMWSLGCIAVELFLGLPLFPGTSEYNQICRIVEMLGLPPQYMLEQGKQTADFFNVYTDEYGRKMWSLKSREQYMKEHNTDEVPSKKYFAATTLPDIVKTYPLSRKSGKPTDAQKEMANRASFVDFVTGLLNLDPHERWTPQQAKLHPFITGEKFVKAFKPPRLSPQTGVSRSKSDTGSNVNKHQFGGLPQTSTRHSGTRAYQDAAAYNQHLAQQQAYNSAHVARQSHTATSNNPYAQDQAKSQQQMAQQHAQSHAQAQAQAQLQVQMQAQQQVAQAQAHAAMGGYGGPLSILSAPSVSGNGNNAGIGLGGFAGNRSRSDTQSFSGQAAMAAAANASKMGINVVLPATAGGSKVSANLSTSPNTQEWERRHQQNGRFSTGLDFFSSQDGSFTSSWQQHPLQQQWMSPQSHPSPYASPQQGATSAQTPSRHYHSPASGSSGFSVVVEGSAGHGHEEGHHYQHPLRQPQLPNPHDLPRVSPSVSASATAKGIAAPPPVASTSRYTPVGSTSALSGAMGSYGSPNVLTGSSPSGPPLSTSSTMPFDAFGDLAQTSIAQLMPALKPQQYQPQQLHLQHQQQPSSQRHSMIMPMTSSAGSGGGGYLQQQIQRQGLSPVIPGGFNHQHLSHQQQFLPSHAGAHGLGLGDDFPAGTATAMVAASGNASSSTAGQGNRDRRYSHQP